MNIHDMTEVAYKNGYEAGKKETQAEIEKLTVELVGMRGACESYKMHYENAQTENERLKKAIKVQDIMIKQQDYKLKSAKSEAIKEFIKEFKDKKFDEFSKLTKELYGYDLTTDINRLAVFNLFNTCINDILEEMTEQRGEVRGVR